MSSEIKVKYEYAPDYRKIPATGAWGGLSPNAEVIINFYVEFKTKPESATLHVDENGHIKEEIQEQDDINLTRELLMGLVLRPDIAKSIGSFLIKHAEMAQEAIAQLRKESLPEGE
jgi:hypothetical protein